MAWLSRVNFISSDTLSFSDINNLGNDIRAWGGNVNGGGYTLSNVVLSASAGTMATVIGGTGTTSTLTLRSTSGVGTTGADIIFQAGNNGATEAMRIQNGGNVGIGTPSPSYKLQVSGGRSVFVANSEQYAIGVGYSSGAGYWIGSNSANTALLFSEGGGSERMRIDSSGNVGIATTNPFSKLQTGGHTFTGSNGTFSNDRVGISNHGILTSIMYASTHNDPTYPDYGMVFVCGPNTSNYNVWSISPDGPAKGSGLNFIYEANSSNIHVVTPKVVFSGNGNVGIGTASPATSAKLEIAGTTGALLVPRLTTTERNALTAVNGMIIYNTTDNKMQGRINGAWTDM